MINDQVLLPQQYSCCQSSFSLITYLWYHQYLVLGVNIDNSLKFEAHVKELCRKVNLKVN